MSEPRLGLHDFNTIPGLLPHELTDSWQPYYLSGIEDADSQPPSLGHGLIYPGLRHTFSGPPESAKTLVAYAIGIDIIRNHPDATILLMDFEMGPKAAKRRWRYVGATDHELDNNILYLAPEQAARIERIEILVALNPTLVIIDAAAGAFDNEDLDDNKRSDAEKWRKLYVDPFFDHGIATLVIDHVVKNTEARGKYAIGSERKTGGGEVHIGFDTIKPVKRGSTGIYKMLMHRDREGHQERGHFCDLHVTSDPTTHTLTCEFRPVDKPDEGEVWMPTHLMEKLSEQLQNATEPLSRNQLELAVAGGNDHKRTALDHLVRLKYAAEHDGPRRSRLYTSTRPFTVSEWEKDTPPATSPDFATTSPRRGADDFATSPPPKGGEATSQANSNGPLRRTESDDPEVQAMLAHYDLLEPANEDPPADLHHQEPT
jgi:hypothetical protein